MNISYVMTWMNKDDIPMIFVAPSMTVPDVLEMILLVLLISFYDGLPISEVYIK